MKLYVYCMVNIKNRTVSCNCTSIPKVCTYSIIIFAYYNACTYNRTPQTIDIWKWKSTLFLDKRYVILILYFRTYTIPTAWKIYEGGQYSTYVHGPRSQLIGILRKKLWTNKQCIIEYTLRKWKRVNFILLYKIIVFRSCLKTQTTLHSHTAWTGGEGGWRHQLSSSRSNR